MTLHDLATLLSDLEAAGVKLALRDGLLKWTAPPGRMTPQLLARAKAAKISILETLIRGALTVWPTTNARARMEEEVGRRPWLGEVTINSLRGMFDWWSMAPSNEAAALGRVLGNLREIEQSRAARLREGRAA